MAGPGAQLYINDGQALHAVRCADDTNCEQGAVTVVGGGADWGVAGRAA